MNDRASASVRLTQLSHGGGCGCKIAPAALRQILGAAKGIFPDALLVGIETSDDDAVYRIDDDRAIVATTDFFMPIVDDPFDFGAIAAPRHLKRNAGARAADTLILGKPLGVGIYGAALKKERLSHERYDVMIASTTQLNTAGIALGKLDAVYALTDVTGFGLLGHLLEICRASANGAIVDYARVPLLPGVIELAREGSVTGASARNWASYGGDVDLAARFGHLERSILTDPQTSGGLLVACAPQAATDVLALFRREGFAHAAAIGEFAAGAPRVCVR